MVIHWYVRKPYATFSFMFSFTRSCFRLRIRVSVYGRHSRSRFFRKMEEDLRTRLSTQGITRCTLDTLEEELITTTKVFCLLKEEHLRKLFPKLKVGQHALLINIWKEYTNEDYCFRPPSTECNSPLPISDVYNIHLQL